MNKNEAGKLTAVEAALDGMKSRTVAEEIEIFFRNKYK